MSLFLRGRQDDEEKTLDASAVLDGEGRLSFKYFQRFNGNLKLPEGFEPWLLLVRVTSKKHGQVEKTYRWDELLAAAG